MMIGEQRNWAGNYRYSGTRWHSPESVEALREAILKGNAERFTFGGIDDVDEGVALLVVGQVAPGAGRRAGAVRCARPAARRRPATRA